MGVECLRCGNQIKEDDFICRFCGMFQNKTTRIVQNDYWEAYDHIKKFGIISNEPCPYDVSEAVQLKREAKFIEANRYYKDLYFKKGILYTDMADWWHKTLAAAGAVTCALSILGITQETANRANGGCISQNYLHLAQLALCIENDCNISIVQYIQTLAGRSLPFFSLETIDFPCGRGTLLPFINNLKNENPRLYFQIKQIMS